MRMACRVTEPPVDACVPWHTKMQYNCLPTIYEELHWRKVPTSAVSIKLEGNIAADYR